MKNFKKVFSLLLVYFFAVTLIPTGLISKIVNAEESVPKFLDYTEGYIMQKNIYKDNVLFMAENAKKDLTWYYLKGNNASQIDGYIDQYIGGSQYTMEKENDQDNLYLFDLEKGASIGKYSNSKEIEVVQNRYKNDKVDVYNVYGTKWHEYTAYSNTEYHTGLITPSYELIENSNGLGMSNYLCDKSGDNLYALFTDYSKYPSNKVIRILNKNGSVREYKFTNNDDKKYYFNRAFFYNGQFGLEVSSSDMDCIEFKKIDFDNANNAITLGETLFKSESKDGEFTQDTNGDFWTVKDGFIKKLVGNQWVNKYEVDKRMNSLVVYDDNNIFVTGCWKEKKGYSYSGIYKSINIASAPVPETKPETPASGNGQGGSATGNSGSNNSTTAPGSTTGASGSAGSTTTTVTAGTTATATTAPTTQNATASTTNKTVVGTAKDGVLPVAVNKLDKDAANIVDATTAASGNKVEVTIADTKAIKEGNGSLQVKAGQNELVNLPFSVVDKSLITDSSKLVLDTTVTDNTDIVKGLKAVKKLYSFDLTLVDGDKRTAIHKFANGSAEIAINLSDEELKGLDKNNLAVFYYNEDTKKFELMDTKVDGNKVTFKTPHFSKFIIAEKSSNSSNSAQVLPKTGSTFGTMSLVILGAVLVLFGFAITRFKRVAKLN